MYIAAAGPNGADAAGAGAGGNNWNRGAMSRRFDSMKEEMMSSQNLAPTVRILPSFRPFH